jgi:hypothetical protein
MNVNMYLVRHNFMKYAFNWSNMFFNVVRNYIDIFSITYCKPKLVFLVVGVSIYNIGAPDSDFSVSSMLTFFLKKHYKNIAK